MVSMNAIYCNVEAVETCLKEYPYLSASVGLRHSARACADGPDYFEAATGASVAKIEG